LGEVAAVERQIGNEFEGQADDTIDLQFHLTDPQRSKAAGFDGDVVIAGGERREVKQSGFRTAGGSIKATQAFAVNAQRPEANNFLLDGVRNVNRMDGGFALRIPIDALQEFRILTHTAPSEYGSAGGASVSVIYPLRRQFRSRHAVLLWPQRRGGCA
jgi:hypothetical protein